MKLSYADLDWLIACVADREETIRTAAADPFHALSRTPVGVGQALSELGALRAKLTAELDRRFASQDAARARGADEATAALELERDHSEPMEAPMRASS